MVLVVVERLGQDIKVTSVSRTEYTCLVDVFNLTFRIRNVNGKRLDCHIHLREQTQDCISKQKYDRSCKKQMRWISDSFLSDLFPLLIFSWAFVHIRS